VAQYTQSKQPTAEQLARFRYRGDLAAEVLT
jgi:hypothetical protein